MKIADVHAHVFPEKLAVKAAGSIGQFYGTEMYCEASMERLVAEEEKAGVSRYVISSSAVVPKQVRSIVEFLAEARKGHPECISFGSIYPGMDGYEEVLDELQALGSRGLKIHPDFQKLPIDDPSGIETYRSIARRGLPVLMHMGDNRYDFSSPERLTNLIRQVPDLIVIAAHFGGWNAWDRSLGASAAGKRLLRHVVDHADGPARHGHADVRQARAGAVFVRDGFPDVVAGGDGAAVYDVRPRRQPA